MDRLYHRDFEALFEEAAAAADWVEPRGSQVDPELMLPELLFILHQHLAILYVL